MSLRPADPFRCILFPADRTGRSRQKRIFRLALGKAAFSDVSFPFSANVVLSKVPWTNEIRCLGARRTNYSHSL
jgi:hypothetical protein